MSPFFKKESLLQCYQNDNHICINREFKWRQHAHERAVLLYLISQKMVGFITPTVIKINWAKQYFTINFNNPFNTHR